MIVVKADSKIISYIPALSFKPPSVRVLSIFISTCKLLLINKIEVKLFDFFV